MTRLLGRPYPFMLLLLFIGGCRALLSPQSVELASQASPEIRAQYEKAISDYHSGDYNGAAKQLKVLRERSSGGALARIALYAQACAELMAAETPQDYQVAMNLWKTWLSCAPNNFDIENPVIMGPLVNEKMLFSNLHPANDDAVTITEEQKTQWVLIKTRQELDKLKRKLVSSENTLKQRDKKINSLEKVIAKLKEQIQALETIDQKIQEKKSAIPSAD